ncbi:hypothetical protein CWE14_13460 [Aliidiomarina soli]|uniref:Rad50/SbcC-type AAA domain-containing protein n=2 Tax=Aliidiomarina soli TaxID=1928574 RepID=A0A432WD90_9GAMM|nr:hypothetical protein CWE14_13460 [Aliidiomarina soli]
MPSYCRNWRRRTRMRITKLRLQNLNSLHGTWEIDFAHPDYVNEGLFAITGPTGAGKTTILDAICLALYGQTPRLGKITKSDNDVMSRHQGECMAEVTFATEQGEYRAFWYQHRARRHAGGALQHPRHELIDAATGKLLEEKVSQVPAVVEQLSGLDFNRFTRSMMLAQGQFAAFLNADEGERSALLEQITGSEIYARISQAAHSKYKMQRDLLQRLQDELGTIQPLAEDERDAIKTELNQVKAQVDETDTQYQACERSAQWVETLTKLEHEWSQLTERQAAHSKEVAEFSEQRKQLEKDAQARPFASALNHLRYLQQQLTRSQQLFTTEQAALPTLKESSEKTGSQAQRARDELATSKEQWTTLQPEIDKARTLDQSLQLIKQRYQSECAQQEKAYHEQTALVDIVSELEQKLSQQQDELQSLTDWLEAHSNEGNLANQLPLLSEQRTQLEQRQAECVAAEQSLKQQRETLQALQSKPSSAQLAQQQDALTKQLSVDKERYKALQEMISQTLLEQKLADFRNELVAGEACPLCGSVEHPAPLHSDASVESTLQTKRSELAELERSLVATQQQLQQLEIEQAVGASERVQQEQAQQAALVREQEHLQRAQQSYTELLQSWQARVSRWLGDEAEVDDVSAAKQTDMLHQLQTMRGRYETTLAKQQGLRGELTSLSARLEGVQEQRAEKQRLSAELKTRVERTGAEREQLQQQRQQLLAGESVAAVVERWQQRLGQAEQSREQLEQQAQQAQQAFERAQLSSQQLQQRVEELEQEQRSAGKQLEAGLNEAGFDDLESLQQALLDDAIQARLSKQARELDASSQWLKTEAERLQRELSEAKAQQPADAAANQLELKRLKAMLADLHQRQGALQTRLEADETLRRQQRDKLDAVKRQQAKTDEWATLDTLIGSADGKKYRKFAQGLTFEIMIDYANQKLRKMTERYLLVRDEAEPLKLNVMDDYQAGEIRSTRNLSGGESFLVSLALALGLAQMASSKVRVDSLFLDEGFGTLDEEALDQALDTLASLRQDGKMIGLISHVGSLKERIATQLQVQAGAAGRSVLAGPGVRQLDPEQTGNE